MRTDKELLDAGVDQDIAMKGSTIFMPLSLVDDTKQLIKIKILEF
ncbi:hypothetical protein [Candidatus Liberibacter sp.]|nr:hypothetical protein [Candidatus Liberibacter sp.]